MVEKLNLFYSIHRCDSFIFL